MAEGRTFMSDAVQVALITNGTIIVVALLSRLWSHFEHRKTERTVNDTNEKVTALANSDVR
jgi:hypothetical protein